MKKTTLRTLLAAGGCSAAIACGSGNGGQLPPAPVLPAWTGVTICVPKTGADPNTAADPNTTDNPNVATNPNATDAAGNDSNPPCPNDD